MKNHEKKHLKKHEKHHVAVVHVKIDPHPTLEIDPKSVFDS